MTPRPRSHDIANTETVGYNRCTRGGEARGRPAHSSAFETLDGCPTHRRIVVDSRRPPVRLSTDEPVDGYSWMLFQHGVVVDSATNVTDGITDGTCIQFRPTVPLRRGRPEDAPLPDGFFYPPFRPRRTYRTETYHGHSDLSVDFNRGNPGDDEGDWVRAPDEVPDCVDPGCGPAIEG